MTAKHRSIRRAFRCITLPWLLLLSACAPGVPPSYQTAFDAVNKEATATLRLERELQAQKEQGRFDDAERTAALLKQRREEHAQRCAQTWRANDEIQRLSEQGRDHDMEKLLRTRTAVFGCERKPRESDDDEVADTQQERLLASAYRRMSSGQYAEAEAILQRAWNAISSQQDGDPALTSQIMTGLAMVAEQQGHLAAAMQWITSAIAQVEKIHGPSARANLAPLLHRQALLLLRSGDGERATKVSERALALYASSPR